MNKYEIRELITPEDKMIVAIRHLTDATYINKLLSGVRHGSSEKGRQILADLEKLAEENKSWNVQESLRRERKEQLIGLL